MAFVAAREEWWLWLSAPALGSRAWWFVARGRRRARMCSLEMRESRLVIVAADSLISRRSGKMGCPLRAGMKRRCEWRQSKNRNQRGGTARHCRPTSRRRDHSQLDSQMDNLGAEDECKVRFYLENNSATGGPPRAVTHRTMRQKCK